MTKKEIVDVICEATEVSKKTATGCLESLVESFTKALKAGDVIKIPGLGRLKVKETKERMGRNPKTGEPMKIKAKKKIVFSAARELKEAVMKKK